MRRSFDCGIVQLAELASPAPSVIRGPFEIGFRDSKLLHFDKSWFINADFVTHGEMMLMTAEADAEGYSAVRALT